MRRPCLCNVSPPDKLTGQRTFAADRTFVARLPEAVGVFRYYEELSSVDEGERARMCEVLRRAGAVGVDESVSSASLNLARQVAASTGAGLPKAGGGQASRRFDERVDEGNVLLEMESHFCTFGNPGLILMRVAELASRYDAERDLPQLEDICCRLGHFERLLERVSALALGENELEGWTEEDRFTLAKGQLFWSLLEHGLPVRLAYSSIPRDLFQTCHTPKLLSVWLESRVF